MSTSTKEMLWPEMADGSTVAQLDVLFVLLASLTLIHAVYRRGALSGTAAVFFLLAHTAFFEHVSLFLGGTHCHATSPLLPMVTPCSSVNSLLFYAPWIYTSLEAARRLGQACKACVAELERLQKIETIGPIHRCHSQSSAP